MYIFVEIKYFLAFLFHVYCNSLLFLLFSEVFLKEQKGSDKMKYLQNLINIEQAYKLKEDGFILIPTTGKYGEPIFIIEREED